MEDATFLVDDVAAVITDGTISLTPFRLDEAPVLMAIDRDPDCARWFDFPEITMDEHAHREHAENVIRAWWQDDAAGSTLHLAIRVDDVAIGTVELRPIRARTASISYSLLATRRGCGYATRAARLVAKHGLENLGYARIELRTDVENVASQRVAERAGFVRTRLDPHAHKFEHHGPFIGQARDEYVYELMR